MELKLKCFECRESNGAYYWDQIRHDVFYHIYLNIIRDSGVVETVQRKGKCRTLFVNAASFLIRVMTIVLFTILGRKTLFLTSSRFVKKNKLHDDILQPVMNLSNRSYLKIEQSNLKLGLIHSKYLFATTRKIFCHSTYSLLDKIESDVKSKFNINVTLNNIANKQINKYVNEYMFYTQLFFYSKINTVNLVQDGIQRGMFHAADNANVEVNEFQHGWFSSLHPAYSYPDINPANNNIYLPARLLTFSPHWHFADSYPIKQFLSIGSQKKIIRAKTNKNPKLCLIVSADIYHYELAKLTKRIAKLSSHINFIYKLHPNQKAHFEIIEKEFSEFVNVRVVGPEHNINNYLHDALFVLLIQSTVSYEALQSNSIVICYKRLNYGAHNDLAGKPNFFYIDDEFELQTILISNLSVTVDSPLNIYFDDFDAIKVKSFLNGKT
jgi:hypothetical protein